MHLHEWLHLVALGDRFGCGFSCYSWWLPPPSRLGAAEEHWHELVIVRGHLPVIVRGLVPSPAKSRKVTLVDCACHWATSLWVGSCSVLVRTRFVLHLLAVVPLSVGWYNGDVACRQACEPWKKNRCLNCVCLAFSRCLIVYILVIGSSPTRRYKYPIISIYLPQSSIISLVAYFALCSIVH